jgi:protein TonB
MREAAAPVTGYAPSQRPRWGTLAVVGLLHVIVALGLVRVFAPHFTASAIEQAASLVTVTITSPPDPTPSAEPAPDAGMAGDEGRKATPREAVAPKAAVPRPNPAPRASSTGAANSSGAGEQGEGPGVGAQGAGTGSGNGGSGTGAGSRPLEKIAGDISHARDYPRAGREARKGHDVVIELTVGTDGRVSACRVTDPSPDPDADAITCRLASQRFVFRPRLNAQGAPVVGVYRWRQRWF